MRFRAATQPLSKMACAGVLLLTLLTPRIDGATSPSSWRDNAANAYLPPALVQAHIVQPGDSTPPWGAAESATLHAAGLPVPVVVRTGASVFINAATPVTWSRPGVGWTPLLRAGWPLGRAQPQCRPFDDDVGVRRAIVARLRPTPTSAPGVGETVRRWVCVFDHLADAHNLMVQFALRLEPRVFAESLFVGVSTDGRTFAGRRWRTLALGAPPTRWQLQRVFFPFIGQQGGERGRVAVLWELRAPPRILLPPGAQLAGLTVERFDPPAGCRDLDPQLHVDGAPGSGMVSKGLNLPPYPDLTPSGLAGHVARLRASGVQWVRVEMQAHTGAALTGRGAQLGYIDLKHYDTLFQLLCADAAPMAVLALLDYAALPDASWRQPAASSVYRAGFTAMSALLARYYRARVHAWEIWNEPDHANTYLAPDAFAHLLVASAAAIRSIDQDARIVSGGLSSTGPAAAVYLHQTLAALATLTPPNAAFDVLGIHLYPSIEYCAGGQPLRDPSYLYGATPTIVVRLMRVLVAAGYGDRPLWVTETGWNRAAESQNPATLSCACLVPTLVDGRAQAAYLTQAFDILFRATAWPSTAPGVTKIFWYQYADVGLPAQAVGCDSTPGAVVDWWYGLYSGTDPAAGQLEPRPNRVACTFRAYPDAAAAAACLAE